MKPELRGAAFALALLAPIPSAHLGEGGSPTPCAASPSEHLSAARFVPEPVGTPLALYSTLRELEVLRTPRGHRTELRNAQTEDRR